MAALCPRCRWSRSTFLIWLFASLLNGLLDLDEKTDTQVSWCRIFVVCRRSLFFLPEWTHWQPNDIRNPMIVTVFSRVVFCHYPSSSSSWVRHPLSPSSSLQTVTLIASLETKSFWWFSLRSHLLFVSPYLINNEIRLSPPQDDDWFQMSSRQGDDDFHFPDFSKGLNQSSTLSPSTLSEFSHSTNDHH